MAIRLFAIFLFTFGSVCLLWSLYATCSTAIFIDCSDEDINLLGRALTVVGIATGGAMAALYLSQPYRETFEERISQLVTASAITFMAVVFVLLMRV